MSIADVLERAADLIEPEGKWTQHVYARGRSGVAVSTRRAAVCFCAEGAINVASGGGPADENLTAIDALASLLDEDFFGDVVEWNDAPERTQAEVVAKLREAAAKAREEGL